MSSSSSSRMMRACPGGSSSTLSRQFWAGSVMAWASSITHVLRWLSPGLSEIRDCISLTSSIPIDAPSGRTTA